MPTRPDVSGALIAGGLSRRMGTDKRLLTFGGETLLERAFRLLEAYCGEVLFAAPEPPPVPVGARHVADRIPGMGVLGGIHAALSEAAHARVVCIAPDTPLLTAGWLDLLVRGCLESGLPCVPHAEGRVHPLPGCYPSTWAGPSGEALATGGVAARELLAASGARLVDEDEARAAGCDPAALANVNTPEDWERLTGPGPAALPRP